MSEKKQIRVSDVLALLDDGKNRAEIQEHYDLSHSDMKKLFQHEKLKGKKPRKQSSFELVDDTIEETSTDTNVSQDSVANTDSDASINDN
jgi:hypothetical protein